MKRLILGAACAFTLTLPLWAGKEFIAQSGEQTKAAELIIRLKQGADLGSVVASVAPGSQVISRPGADTHLVKVMNRPLANASGDFARHQSVEFVEPNRIRRSTGGLPGLNDPNSGLQWALTTVRAALAWNIIPSRYLSSGTAGSGRIRVAVLDTGGDCTHNDFKNSGGASVDSAQGGQISMALSQAPVATTVASPACAWQDDYGHGTHVMGIVAAATQNAVGVASLGYPIELVNYKILNSSGSGDDFTISQAVRAATDAGIHIISLSLGGTGYSQTFQDAITYAWQRNTIVIAAAGNSGANALFFPAGANYAIGVAATDSANNKAGFSNFGAAVDIAAPGVGIYSTLPSYANPLGAQNYGYLSGTSMATPFVSGLAGLVALTTPNFSTAAVAQRIQQSAASSIAGGGWDQTIGYGIIDAFQAVSGALRPATLGSIVGQVTNSSGVPITGATVIAAGQSRTTTGDGLYRIQNVPAGSYTLTASASGFASQNPTVVVTPGADTNVTVAMGVATGNFTGTVTTGGASVSGAVVQALSAGLIKATTFSASNGLYVLSVPPGTYDIQVAGMSRITSKALSKTISAGGSLIVDLTLPKMGVIAGTVRDGSSTPVANAFLTFSQTGFSAGAITDSSGNYASIGLPSGSYSVTASATGFPDAIINNVVVSADAITTINPQLGSGVGITLTPPSVSLTANQTAQFTATVTGTGNTAVTWSINPLVGSFSNGLYTAPASITIAQAITVTATSVADGSKSASSVVNLTPAASAGWYAVGGTWSNRKAITIDHNKAPGGSSLSSFPMLFSVTDVNLKTVGNGGSVGRTDGKDILFTASDGLTKLNHEIELYNGATGQLITWVNIPALSGVADTQLYVYYGNASAVDQQNKAAVWDSNHQGVWHMAETSGTTLADATSNGRNATKLGANNPASSAGFIGNGQTFIGTANSTNNDYANFAATAASSVYTVEFWVRQTSVVGYDIVVRGADTWSSVYFLWYPSNRLQMRDHWSSFDLGALSGGVWHHLAVVRNGNSVSSYVDGALAISASGAGTSPEIFAQMGFAGADGVWNSLNGKLDELRISNTARSAAWIGAEYNNQNSPSTFYSVGGQQSSGAGGTVSVTVTTAPAGLSLLVDSAGCTAPCTFQWTPGSNHTIGVTSTTQAGTSGTQFLFASWSDSGAQSHSITAAAATYTANFNTQYFLTTAATAGGVISPSSGWISAGAVQPVNAAPNAGFQFSGFTGALSGTSTPQNLTLNGPATVTANFGAIGSPWYSVGGTWTSRKAITIDHNKVPGGSSLANFPVLFSVTDANLKTVSNGGSVGRTDGKDILFTASDAVTKLNHEIELYNGATGQLIAWVKIPSLSGVTDTQLYVYYGNASAGDQENKTAVWDSNHQGVWHMAETSGTTLWDATSNGRNATKRGASNPASTAGFIGNGQTFVGTSNSANNDYASFAATAASTVYTVEFWVKQTSVVGYDVVVTGGSAATDTWSSVYFLWYPSNRLEMRQHWNPVGLGALTTGVWHHIAVVRNGNSASSYVDGTLALSVSGGGTNPEIFAQMGFAGADGVWNSLNGKLDELRISNTARPAAWIGTEFNNQNSPSTFYTVGGQQSNSAGALK